MIFLVLWILSPDLMRATTVPMHRTMAIILSAVVWLVHVVMIAPADVIIGSMTAVEMSATFAKVPGINIVHGYRTIFGLAFALPYRLFAWRKRFIARAKITAGMVQNIKR